MIRLLQILSHYITVAILFCLIIISGQSTGFFYLTLLMLGLTHVLLHSVLGIVGLVLVFLSGGKKTSLVKAYIGLLGAFCMVLSLVRFFTQPGGGYNYPTFHQFVPLLTLTLFFVSLIFFVFRRLRSLIIKRSQSIMPA